MRTAKSPQERPWFDARIPDVRVAPIGDLIDRPPDVRDSYSIKCDSRPIVIDDRCYDRLAIVNSQPNDRYRAFGYRTFSAVL